MLFKSIRWRLQLWLAFLLVCLLSGFGFTVYQLQRVSQVKQLDEELERRVAVISGAIRGGAPKTGVPPLPVERRPENRELNGDSRKPNTSRRFSDAPGVRGDRKGPFGPRDFRFRKRSQTFLTEAAQALFTSSSGPAMALYSSGLATRLLRSLCQRGLVRWIREPMRGRVTNTVKPSTLPSLPIACSPVGPLALTWPACGVLNFCCLPPAALFSGLV